MKSISATRRTSKSNHFIHFGCWNRGGCDLHSEAPNSLTRVMRTLNRSKPDFITVCGDNYYPDKLEDKEKVKDKDKTKDGEKKDKEKKKDKDGDGKKKKVKLVSTEELKSGFNCLPKNIPIYMSYGNHDLETGLVVDGLEENTCKLTTIEMMTATERKNINLSLFQHIWFGNKNLIIMLETSLYDNVEPDKITLLEKCYGVVDSNIHSLDEMHELQMNYVRSLIPDISRAYNIIVIGHHPLAYLKYKKNTVIRETLQGGMFDILKEIKINSQPGASFYYLCADYHQYTEGTVVVNSSASASASAHFNMTIHQYIVGTGGATIDSAVMEEYREHKETDYNVPGDADEYNVSYIMTEDNINNTVLDNGYLVVKRTSDNKIQCKFVNAMNMKSGSKSRRKQQK